MENKFRREVSVKNPGSVPSPESISQSSVVDMLALVSHELKTPLTIIKTALENMTLQWDVVERRQEMLEMCNRAIHRLISLLDDFMDLAKIEAGQIFFKKESISVTELVHQVSHLFMSEAHRKGIQLKNNMKDSLPKVVGDTSKLNQVLMNLIDNAVKYTGSGGTITIEAHPKAHMLEIFVQDTGIGVPKADQKLIFKKFHRAKNSQQGYKGSGLGLYICKALVEAQGGKIGFKSQLHKGSTFFFTLPLASDHG